MGGNTEKLDAGPKQGGAHQSHQQFLFPVDFAEKARLNLLPELTQLLPQASLFILLSQTLEGKKARLENNSGAHEQLGIPDCFKSSQNDPALASRPSQRVSLCAKVLFGGEYTPAINSRRMLYYEAFITICTQVESRMARQVHVD